MTQGVELVPEKITKIRKLLKQTDMNLSDIAKRMGCSRAAVQVINAQYRIRDYHGTRNRFELTHK